MRHRRGAVGGVLAPVPVRPRSRVRRAGGAVALAATLAIVTGGCNLFVTGSINSFRSAAGQQLAVGSSTLNSTAASHASAMCSAASLNPSNYGSYGEAAGTAAHEMIGSAPLDPSITNANARDFAATQAIWSHWKNDPELAAAKWSAQGVGQSTCADGNLYMAAVLKGPSTVPATGRYTSQQYDPSTIQQFLGIQYTSAVDYTGTTIPLLLDVYTPPASAPSPRPTVVLIHGGAFVGGSRTDMSGVALQWAIRGYDAVSIDYRLDQSLYQDSSPPKELAAATNATIDAEQSVRWMKANAATYGIDPTRILAVGYSAGGAVSLGMAAAPDFQQTGPNATYSSVIQAAISTGAYLTPGIDLGVLHFAAGLAPIMMFHYETDVASNTGAYAYRTCSAYRDAGSACDYVGQAGEGHTTDLTPGSVWWANEIGPFVFQNLHIGS